MATRAEPKGSVTRLLVSWRAGCGDALADIVERVYPDLRRIAANRLRRDRTSHSLSPTALVHEVYLKLLDGADIDWKDRAHFLAVCSTVMRRVLVEHARRSRARKRQAVHVALAEDHAVTRMDVDALDLDAALRGLESDYPFEAKVVELRYFGGLTIDEAAEHLGVGHATVQRAWTFSKAWLAREIDAAPA